MSARIVCAVGMMALGFIAFTMIKGGENERIRKKRKLKWSDWESRLMVGFAIAGISLVLQGDSKYSATAPALRDSGTDQKIMNFTNDQLNEMAILCAVKLGETRGDNSYYKRLEHAMKGRGMKLPPDEITHEMLQFPIIAQRNFTT